MCEIIHLIFYMKYSQVLNAKRHKFCFIFYRQKYQFPSHISKSLDNISQIHIQVKFKVKNDDEEIVVYALWLQINI